MYWNIGRDILQGARSNTTQCNVFLYYLGLGLCAESGCTIFKFDKHYRNEVDGYAIGRVDKAL